MLGVLQTQDALRRARDQGLDLVEINPKANPPVCKILDYGKYKYDEKKKKRETKRKQSTVEVKEVKLRPKTDDHDLDFKARAARRFIESGNKVKFTVRFRGREITHPQKAREQLEWIQSQCEDIANVEGRPSMEGRTMTMIMSPKPAVLQAVANAKAQAEKERKEAEQARKAGKHSSPGKSSPGKSSPGKSSPGKSSPGKSAKADASEANGEKADRKSGKGKSKSGKGKSSKSKSGKGKSKDKAEAAETESS
jgi:translation initiation factor IF-3